MCIDYYIIRFIYIIFDTNIGTLIKIIHFIMRYGVRYNKVDELLFQVLELDPYSVH